MNSIHPTLQNRSSGLLLHPTSLPGGHGIGDLGMNAYKFIDFLKDSGQSWWQMLPINPPGYGGSPYNAISAFAGNPLLIDLNSLKENGLLTRKDIPSFAHLSRKELQINSVEKFKNPLLSKAVKNFWQKNKDQEKKHFAKFRRDNNFWLEDFSLFCSLKERFNLQAWTDWDIDIIKRKPKALRYYENKLKDRRRYHKTVQFFFHQQWNLLHDYAHKKGVGLIGDVPIFVAHDSAEVWSHQKLFKLDNEGRSTHVAGVPPDYFSRTGQLWGNPVYKWVEHKKSKYDWWTSRLNHTFSQFDAIRLDHFIGFYRAWEVKVNSPTAEYGKWIPGPRNDFFRTLKKNLNRFELIAEDLGSITPEITRMRKRFSIPGMAVMQFMFGGDFDAVCKRIDRIGIDTVAYTGTHDNDTVIGWYQNKNNSHSSRDRQTIVQEMANVKKLLGTKSPNIHWPMMEFTSCLPSKLCIFPVQDLLGLNTDHRMNKPGTSGGNWTWRLASHKLAKPISNRLLLLTRQTGRI